MNKLITFTCLGLALVMLNSCDSADSQNEDTSEALIADVPAFKHNPMEVIEANGMSIEVFDYENFEPFLNQKDNKIHIINFWATWCIPCVEELPYFEALGQKYPEVEITLVSLDFINLVADKLIPFIQENDLKSEVILLREVDFNSWMPKVSEDWSGAIPATVIYKNDISAFYEQSFTFETLEQAMNDLEK